MSRVCPHCHGELAASTESCPRCSARSPAAVPRKISLALPGQRRQPADSGHGVQVLLSPRLPAAVVPEPPPPDDTRITQPMTAVSAPPDPPLASGPLRGLWAFACGLLVLGALSTWALLRDRRKAPTTTPRPALVMGSIARVEGRHPSASTASVGTGIFLSSDGLLVTDYELVASPGASVDIELPDGRRAANVPCVVGEKALGVAVLRVPLRQTEPARPASLESWRDSMTVFLLAHPSAQPASQSGPAPTLPQPLAIELRKEPGPTEAWRLHPPSRVQSGLVVSQDGQLLGMASRPPGKPPHVVSLRSLWPLLQRARRQPGAAGCGGVDGRSTSAPSGVQAQVAK